MRRKMKQMTGRFQSGKSAFWRRKSGMEMVQVAILIAIAVALGIIFKTQITAFVNAVFRNLDAARF